MDFLGSRIGKLRRSGTKLKLIINLFLFEDQNYLFNDSKFIFIDNQLYFTPILRVFWNFLVKWAIPFTRISILISTSFGEALLN